MEELLKPYAVVRVRKLVGHADEYDGWHLNQRPPEVGDVGALLDMLTAPGMPNKFVVESSAADGTTLWLSDFFAEELEVVEDYPKCSQ